jgi:hypothetical protein
MKRTSLGATRWHSEWYERTGERLVLEQRAMSDRFPQFQLFQDGAELLWRGRLTTNDGNAYEIMIKYPRTFPDDPPEAYPLEPPVAAYKTERSGVPKHQYHDGRLCLYYPADRTLQKETTAATVVALSAAWLFAYEQWLKSGKKHWPGKEAD